MVEQRGTGKSQALQEQDGLSDNLHMLWNSSCTQPPPLPSASHKEPAAGYQQPTIETPTKQDAWEPRGHGVARLGRTAPLFSHSWLHTACKATTLLELIWFRLYTKLWELVYLREKAQSNFILFALGILLYTKDGVSHTPNPSISGSKNSSSFYWCWEGQTKPRVRRLL